MAPWSSADIDDDELKELSILVIDFARSVGLRDADDLDLLQIVVSAYLTGKKAGRLGAIQDLVDPGNRIVQ